MLISRQDQKTQTRRKLIRVAFRQFTEKGFAPTRTLDVARRAGVSHGTVFAHFPTRDDLVIQVIEEFGIKATRRMADLIEKNVGLRGVLEAHLRTLEEYELFYSRLITEKALLGEAAKNTLLGIQSAIAHYLFDAIKKEGVLAERGLKMHLIFNTWIGLIHHYLSNRELFAPGESVIARYGKELIDYFLGLLIPDKGE